MKDVIINRYEFQRAWNRIKTYLSNRYYEKSVVERKHAETLGEAKDYADGRADEVRQAGIADLEAAKQRTDELLAEIRQTLSNVKEGLEVEIDKVNQKIQLNAGHIDEITGKISTIQATIDNIHQIVALELASILSDPEGEAVKAIKIIIDNETSHITSTVFEHVMREVDGRFVTNDRFSEVTQDLEGLHATVSNIESDVAGTKERVGTLELTAEHFDARITTNEGRVGELEVKSGEISLVVSELEEGGNYAAIIAKLNEDSSSEVTIKADKIALLGETVAEVIESTDVYAARLKVGYDNVQGAPSKDTIGQYIAEYLEKHPVTTGDTVTVQLYTNDGREYDGAPTNIDETLQDHIVKRLITVTHNSLPKTYTEYFADNDKNYLITNVGVGEDENFLVSTEGLLTAKNAIIYGTVYADTGRFATLYVNGDDLIVGANGDKELAKSYFDSDGILHCKGIVIQDGNITWASITDADSKVSNNSTVKSAASDAATAKNNASTALNTANSANSTANTANSTAINAQTLANQALAEISAKDEPWVTNITKNTITTAAIVAQNLTVLAGNVSGKLTAGQLDLTGASLNYSQISNPPEIPSDSKINTLIKNYISEHPITTGDTITIVDYTNDGRQYEGKSTQKDGTLPNGIIKRIIMVTHNGTNTTYTEYMADNDEGYLLTNVGKGSDSEGSNGFFKVDTAGLLKARNAIIYGSVFADTGYFGNMYIDGKKIIAGSTDYRNANSYFDDNGILHCKGIRISEGIITWESISNADSMVSGNASVQQAITNAGAAATNASNALAIAGDAADTANYAEAAANTAQNTANTANSNATKAKNAADNAQSTADSAQSTANSANTKATNAQTTANQAVNTANTALTEVNKKTNDWVTEISQYCIKTATITASQINTEGLTLKALNNENNVGSISIANGVISLLDSSGNIRLNISGDKITGSSQSPISGNISFGVSANNVSIPSGGYANAVAQTSKVSFTCNKTGSLVISLPAFSVRGSFNSYTGNKSIMVVGTVLVDDKLIGTIQSGKTIYIPLGSVDGTVSYSATKFYAGVGSGTHTIQIKFDITFNGADSEATLGNFIVDNSPKADYTVTFGSQYTQIGSNGFRMMSNGTDMVEFLTNDYNSGIYSIRCGSGGSSRGIKIENGTLKLLIGNTTYALSVENGYVKASTTSW